MKVAPTCLIIIIVLFSNSLFSQENNSVKNEIDFDNNLVSISESDNSQIKEKNQTLVKTMNVKQNMNSLEPSNSIVFDTKIPKQTKAAIETSEALPPRTTIDFF